MVPGSLRVVFADVVKARDPKGLYAKVAAGQIKNFTGIDSPYEAPLKPEVTLKTHELPIEKSVDVLIDALRRSGLHPGPPDAASAVCCMRVFSSLARRDMLDASRVKKARS